MKEVIFATVLVFLGSRAIASVIISTVPVGNLSNGNDPSSGNQFGGVNHYYSIGKYDVTVGQYTAFLNAVAATDTYGLYNTNMATDLNVAGISQNGSSGSYTYNVIGSPNHPITYVSWGDAARFVNWLNNGQPTGGEILSTTEDGAYFLNGATTDQALNAVTRKNNAKWVIPTESEWYKAAYYNSATATYNLFPSSSFTIPTSAPPSNTPNSANYYDIKTGYAVTGSTTLSSTQNYLTDVGAYTTTSSPYGAFDMGGDVFQWNETLFNTDRGLFGGSWRTLNGFLSSNSWALDGSTPGSESSSYGFRVAEVLIGDFNRDGYVDAKDIAAMLQALINEAGYAQSNGLTTSQVSVLGDVNGDGTFTNADLQKLLAVLKAGGGSSSVPEPSTFALVGLESAFLASYSFLRRKLFGKRRGVESAIS